MTTSNSNDHAPLNEESRSLRIIFLLFCILLLPSWLQAQHFTGCPVHHGAGDRYENPLYDRWLSRYDVKFMHLALDVTNTSTVISGKARILIETVEVIDTLVFQLIDPLDVTLVEVNETGVTTFIHRNNAIYIPVSLRAGQEIEVEIQYDGDAGQNRGFFAGITSRMDVSSNQQVTYTLSEPLNARDWFPVKQVLEDKLDSVWIDLTCPDHLMAGSNGLLVDVVPEPGNKHTFQWRSRYPIAYYLVSLAVADYRDYSFNAPLSKPGDSVLVQNFIYDDDEYFNRWKDRIDATGPMIGLFSTLVQDYPFAEEKYGHCVAPMGGGMEHQTMSTMAGFGFTLVAHELAHQWYGDHVTCASWQDIWINEGFASYFEYIALQKMEGQEEADAWMKSAMSMALSESGSLFVPAEQADNVMRVFDYGLTYKKGAVLLHMIRNQLDNDAQFFDVLSAFSQKYAFGQATGDQFREVLDSVSGKDFSCFFEQWYYGKGHPLFYISWNKQNDTLYINSLQETSQAETPLFKTPFEVEIISEGTSRRTILYQQKNEEKFAIPFEGIINDIVFDPDRKLLAKGSVVSKQALESKIVVGPNPFDDSLVMQFFQSASFDWISLYDLNGNLVLGQEITSNPYELNTGAIPAGAYLLVVKGSDGAFREKVLKGASR